jgi:hypothetical protein
MRDTEYVIPAQPGFTALQYHYGEDNGGVEKLQVIAWVISTNGRVSAITFCGVQAKGELFAVMQPDGHIISGDNEVWDNYEHWLRGMNKRVEVV